MIMAPETEQVALDGNAAPPSDDGQMTDTPEMDAETAAGEETPEVSETPTIDWDADDNPHKTEAQRLKEENARLKSTLDGTRGNLKQLTEAQRMARFAADEEAIVKEARQEAESKGFEFGEQEEKAVRTFHRGLAALEQERLAMAEAVNQEVMPLKIRQWAEDLSKKGHPAPPEVLAAIASLGLPREAAERMAEILKTEVYGSIEATKRSAKLDARAAKGVDRTEGGAAGAVKTFNQIEQDYQDGKVSYETYAAARQKAGIY